MSRPESPEPLRAAIIGTGFMGSVHARAVRVNGARLVGVAAASPESAAKGARALSAEGAFRSAEELVIDPEVDVVHICTPNDLHARLAEMALEAGKHVICEKPLVSSLAEAASLLELARRSGVVNVVPYVYRYYPMVRQARHMVSAGELGKVLLIHGSYLQDWLLDPSATNWRVDSARGGPSRAFADIGSHWCDLAEFISGERISAVSCQMQVAIPDRPDPLAGGRTFGPAAAAQGGRGLAVRTEDIAAMMFKTANGILGSMLVSQVSAGHKNHLQIEVGGARASVSFDQQAPDELRVGRSEATVILERDLPYLAASAARYSRLPAGHPQGYQDCFDALIADAYTAIRAGASPEPLPTFEDGAHGVAIIDAVISSALDGGAWTEVVADVRPALRAVETR
jgi:predicted dehydrogenase